MAEQNFYQNLCEGLTLFAGQPTVPVIPNTQSATAPLTSSTFDATQLNMSTPGAATGIPSTTSPGTV